MGKRKKTCYNKKRKAVVAMTDPMQQLQLQCASCRNCPLGDTRTNLVFGVGDPTAKVLFVGEGPGEQEDLKGEPFVGKSGQLLDQYLSLIDRPRDGGGIYIANIVKCRPPHNRDPKPEESESCLPWLRAQVRILRPRIIVCLGRIAAQRLMDPDFRVTREHGVFREKGGILFMGTFHPAALLRNPAQKKDALSDFQALRDKMAELGL